MLFKTYSIPISPRSKATLFLVLKSTSFMFIACVWGLDLHSNSNLTPSLVLLYVALINYSWNNNPYNFEVRRLQELIADFLFMIVIFPTPPMPYNPSIATSFSARKSPTSSKAIICLIVTKRNPTSLSYSSTYAPNVVGTQVAMVSPRMKGDGLDLEWLTCIWAKSEDKQDTNTS